MPVPAWVAGTFCPMLGLVICTFMWLSPFKAVYDAKKAKDLGPLNVIPFTIAFVQCIGWTIYGCMMRDYYVFWGNTTGIILGLYYTLTCLALMAKKSELDDKRELCQNVMVFGIAFWCIIAMIASIVYPPDDYSRVQAKIMVGTISCAGGLSYYAAPLSTLLEVIRKKDSSTLHEPMIIVNFLNGLLWSVYGKFAINDILIWGPNFVGIILASIQLFFSRIFPKTEQLEGGIKLKRAKEDEKNAKKSSTTVNMTPVMMKVPVFGTPVFCDNNSGEQGISKDTAVERAFDGRGDYQSPLKL